MFGLCGWSAISYCGIQMTDSALMKLCNILTLRICAGHELWEDLNIRIMNLWALVIRGIWYGLPSRSADSTCKQCAPQKINREICVMMQENTFAAAEGDCYMFIPSQTSLYGQANSLQQLPAYVCRHPHFLLIFKCPRCSWYGVSPIYIFSIQSQWCESSVLAFYRLLHERVPLCT